MTATDLYRLGWQAAMHGESRDWCVERGANCVRGYDDYWEYYGP